MPESEAVEEKQPIVEESPEALEGSESEDSTAVDPAVLEAQRDAALEECEKLKDRLMRTQADFENIRKRLEREKQEVIRFAPSETIKALLPIADDFERAISADSVAPEVKEGLELIHKQMFEVFRRAGLQDLEQYETFDPTVHCAVDRAPAEEGQSDQKILAVYLKGYLFQGRLLRDAMVKVAVEG